MSLIGMTVVGGVIPALLGAVLALDDLGPVEAIMGMFLVAP